MAKLVLRKSCYEGIKHIKKQEIQRKPNHDNYVKAANQKIEERRIRNAAAYENAGSYLGK